MKLKIKNRVKIKIIGICNHITDKKPCSFFWGGEKCQYNSGVENICNNELAKFNKITQELKKL